MGIAMDAAEEVDLSAVKVHRSICAELMNLVDQVAVIRLKIEAARPGCSSGLQALCQLSGVIEKSKSLIQSCCESSKLYMAISGDVTVSRCERWRNLIERSLTQLQTMVPVLLSTEISRNLDFVKSVKFTLDSSEEEAGNALRELICHYASNPDTGVHSEIEALQIAASRLHIDSQRSLLVERRSIKKLLGTVSDSEQKKRQILEFLSFILRKHGKSMIIEKAEEASPQLKASNAAATTQVKSQSMGSIKAKYQMPYPDDKTQISTDSIPIPPQELICPISLRMMFDPVVIASGETFERMWIAKWFDEGHVTCPKTNMKLPHLYWSPNTAIRDLISKWCLEHGVTVSDPSREPEEDIYSVSIASFGRSMNSLHLPKDDSNVSVSSLGSYYSESDSSHVTVANLQRMNLSHTNSDFPRSRFGKNALESILENLSRLSLLPWETQLETIEEAGKNLTSHDEIWTDMSESVVEPVTRFLKDACYIQDVQAQKAGSQLLSALVRETRNEIPELSEDTYLMLVELLSSDLTEEILAIIEVLSGHKHCRCGLVSSGALSPLINFLDSPRVEYHVPVIKILYNMCLDNENHHSIVTLECIPKLAGFLRSDALAKFAIVIMKTLCDVEKARIAIGETSGCIASIVELLETGSREDQENAVSILLILCSQQTHWCQRVMDEGVIPSLFNISINGNNRGKASATELLRTLRDIDYEQDHHDDEPDIHDTYSHRPREESPKTKTQTTKAVKPTTKTPGFFSRRFQKLTAPKKKK